MGASPDERGVHVWSAEQSRLAGTLIAVGVNDAAIARQIGVPRATVRDWRLPLRDSGEACERIAMRRRSGLRRAPRGGVLLRTRVVPRRGCVSRDRRVWRLRIVLDMKYPTIIGRCPEAINMLMSEQHAAIVQARECVDVTLYSKRWPCLLPQHGPGRKHTRLIRLEPWEQARVNHATEVGLFTGALDSLESPRTRSSGRRTARYR
jgi:hypothetical protein